MSMRKVIDILSITLLIASPIALGVYTQTVKSQTLNQQVDVTTQKNFPLNKAQVIEFEPNQGFKKFTERQKLDQLRDWLLITVLSGKGLDSKKINDSIYDIQTVRYDFMNSVANFEYGTTRSRYIGDGKVVAIVPKTSSKEERINNLADIADSQRKNLGEKPKVIEVFEYEISPNNQLATITRRNQINGEEIFSSAYGYYETIVSSKNDLQNFLNQVDDTTFAQNNGDSLSLGGRKIDGINHQKIQLEDIAALWQSEKKIQEHPQDFNYVRGSGFSLDTGFDYSGLKKTLDNVKPLLQAIKLDDEPIISEQDIEQAKEGLTQKKIQFYRQLVDQLQNFVNSEQSHSLLSKEEIGKQINQELQPYIQKQKEKIKNELKQYDNQLHQEIISDIANAHKLGKSSEDIKQEITAKYKQNQEKFERFKQNLVKSKREEVNKLFVAKRKEKAAEINNFLRTEVTKGFTYARYNGDLQGTEVGMNLFYTDLLAKIWGFDYANSTPEKQIQDFKAQKNITVSAIYKEELKKISATRIWFEPNTKELQVASAGKNLLFSRIATKVSARSHNPLEGDVIPVRQESKEKNQVSIPISPTFTQAARADFGGDSNSCLTLNKTKKIDDYFCLKPTNPSHLVKEAPNVVEEAPNAISRAFVNFWNNHYREVAKFEPQYEKLNAIMKWSLLISWINHSGNNNLFNFLTDVGVKHDLNFSDWVQANKSHLKFQNWDTQPCNKQSETTIEKPVCFYKPGDKGTKTETLPFLRSKSFKQFNENIFLYGGVSLGEKKLFNELPILNKSTSVDEVSLRPKIDYNSVKIEDNSLTFKSLPETENLTKDGNISQGTTYKFTAKESEASTTITPDENFNFRSTNAELTNQPITSKVTQNPQGTDIENTIGDTPFNDLNIKQTENGFKVAFKSRGIDAGYHKALRLSTVKGDILNPLKNMDDVAQVRYSPLQPNDYYVKLSESQEWFIFREEPQVVGEGGKQLRLMTVSESGESARIFNVQSLSEEQVLQETQGFQEFFGKGVDPQEPLNFHEEAQELAQDPVKYTALTKAYLKQSTQNIKETIKSGDYPKASKLIDELDKSFPSDPDLSLLKVEVKIHQGIVNVEEITTQGAQPVNFLDEINNRNFNLIETDHELTYVQDSPTFNNLDFRNGVQESITLKSGARLYRLKPGKIGTSKISENGFGDVRDSINPSTQYKGGDISNSLRTQFDKHPKKFINKCGITEKDEDENARCCQESNEEDNNKNSNCITKKPVYILIKSE